MNKIGNVKEQEHPWEMGTHMSAAAAGQLQDNATGVPASGPVKASRPKSKKQKLSEVPRMPLDPSGASYNQKRDGVWDWIQCVAKEEADSTPGAPVNVARAASFAWKEIRAEVDES